MRHALLLDRQPSVTFVCILLLPGARASRVQHGEPCLPLCRKASWPEGFSPSWSTECLALYSPVFLEAVLEIQQISLKPALDLSDVDKLAGVQGVTRLLDLVRRVLPSSVAGDSNLQALPCASLRLRGSAKVLGPGPDDVWP